MSYYHGLISSRRANSLLNQRPDGSFLIRDSQSQPGNFVLSAKYVGRMYHVLIFQQAGKYLLDSAGETGVEGGVDFNSLDELVLFLTGHNLKVGDDEVRLTNTCPCDSSRISSNSVSKVKDSDDSDLMTDVFAALFGTRSVVVCVSHSSVSLDGQQGDEERCYWVALVKDLEQKGYFIRVVDKEEKTMTREKKVGKQFQYDMPGDLVMTFLSEHGITCIGFRDTQEKDRFLHQIDRVVKLQQERSIKLRARAESDATSKKNPTDITHRIKASEFDVDNLSAEWKYLFKEAGVTETMLKDKATLQFILDTMYEIGGAPQKLPTITAEASGDDPLVNKTALEMEQALSLDEKLKKESVRASMLSDLLQKKSLLKNPPCLQREHICSYLALCERYKDYLVIKQSMIALGPENGSCYCDKCASGKPSVQTAGSPPQQFTLPVGWAQFIHSSQNHVLAQHFSRHWHVAYCRVPASRVASIMRTGQLVHSHCLVSLLPPSQPELTETQWSSDHVPELEVILSPDIQHACSISSLQPEGFHDKVSGNYYKVQTVFQILIQPGTYSVHISEEVTGSSKLEWHAKERTYIVHSLWLAMTEVD